MSESPYGLIWPHGTRPFGTLGSAAAAPAPRHRQRGPGGRRRRRRRRRRRDRRAAAAQPGRHARATGDAGGDRGAPSSTAGCTPATSSPSNADGTYTFVARKKEVLRRRGENLSPAEVEDAILGAPRRRSRCAVVGVPSELTEEEVKAFVVAATGRAAGLRRAAGRGRRSGCPRSRCRASGRLSTPCRARRRRGSPSTGCRRAPARGVRREAHRRGAADDRLPDVHRHVRRATRSRCSATTSPAT